MLSLTKTCGFGTFCLHTSGNSTGFQQNLGIYCLRYLWKSLLNHSNITKCVAASGRFMIQWIQEKRDWGLTCLGKQLQCPHSKLISISPSWSKGNLKMCAVEPAFLVQEFSTFCHTVFQDILHVSSCTDHPEELKFKYAVLLCTKDVCKPQCRALHTYPPISGTRNRDRVVLYRPTQGLFPC